EVNDITSSTVQKTTLDIAWQRPEDGWILLNIDGASKNGATAGCGAILRNSHGQWISGFSRNLGRCNAYLAELWGVFDGLRLARERGITKLKVHVDSQIVVQTLNSNKMIGLWGGDSLRKFVGC
ncbi:ribonuclease H, partial [Trifolium pratense]